MSEDNQELDNCQFDTVYRQKDIENITITGQMKRPSMITIFLTNGETVSFEAIMESWRRGFTASIEGRRGMRLDDGQTVETAAKKEQDAD